MAVVTMNGSDQIAIEKCAKWLIFDVDFSADTATTTATLRVLPKDTVVLDGWLNCVAAEIGGTTADVDMEVGAEGWWTGTADNGGVIDVFDHGASKYQYIVPDTTAALRTLEAVFTENGTTTTGPIVRVGVLVYRPTF